MDVHELRMDPFALERENLGDPTDAESGPAIDLVGNEEAQVGRGFPDLSVYGDRSPAPLEVVTFLATPIATFNRNTIGGKGGRLGHA